MILAGIISLQANFRCLMQMTKYKRIKQARTTAAKKIQSVFRSNLYFDVRLLCGSCNSFQFPFIFLIILLCNCQDYTHRLVDITLCQSYVRQWIAKKDVLKRSQRKQLDAKAVIIQSRWRVYAARCDYVSKFMLQRVVVLTFLGNI